MFLSRLSRCPSKTLLPLRFAALLNHPVAPMLANPIKDLRRLPPYFPKGFFVEIKYDGDRIQIHKKGKDLQFFSRSLKPFSATKIETIIPQLLHCLQDVDGVFDGEFILADKISRKPLPFYSSGHKKRLEYPNGVPCVVFFDVMNLHGKSVESAPLHQRREMLQQVLRKENSELEGLVMTSKTMTWLSSDPVDELRQRLAKHDLEGFMIKDAQSTYVPGSRNWFKIKPDYIRGFVDTLDLVVVGGYQGTGRRGSLISSFLCAVRDDSVISPASAVQYRTVCKVSGGFSDEKLREINSQVSFVKRAQPPSWLVMDIPEQERNAKDETAEIEDTEETKHTTAAAATTTTRTATTKTRATRRVQAPDVYVEDVCSSVVWEILGASLLPHSKHHSAGVSVRFPRVVRERPDKDAYTATTWSQLKHMAE